ncbi:MAG: sodium/solute symporter [Planctomycetes bacterium]|nr:sodium/solute symporter [Planctomycetota bacterium]
MSVFDLFIIGAYLFGVVAVGAWFSKRQKTTRQYFTGGGKVPWWAVAASIVATETSTVTFISVPGNAYAKNGNFTFLQLALGYIVGRIVISVLFIPMYFKGELLTVYQLLTRRFGTGVKALLAGLFVIMRTVGDGIRLLLTAGVLAFVWRAFSPQTDAAFATIASVVAMGIVMILFTLWGGMEAVIWIEVGQLFIYIFGALAAAAVLLQSIPGGLGGAFETAAARGKTQWLQFAWSFDKSAGYTIFAGVIGGCFLTMATHGTDQYLVQRYLCVDRPGKAAAALLVSGVVVFIQFALFLTIGILLFCYYKPYEMPGYADAAGAFPFARTDAVFTDFITKHLPAGVGGLVVAAILAAALSSSLNSIAATAVNDLIAPFSKRRDDGSLLKLSKKLTVAAGILQIACAIAVIRTDTSALESVLTVAGLLNGPVLGIFLLGTFVPRAGRIAALSGLAAGAAALALICIFYTDLFFAWFTAAGAIATLLAGTVVSFIIKEPETNV